MAHSGNGYEVISRSKCRTIEPVAGCKFYLRGGPVSQLFDWLIYRFHNEVEPISGPVLDDWSYANRNVRGARTISNHASGTAVDLNATQHPLGASGTFNPHQVRAIRRILNDAKGCLRWGGDYNGRKDEMHFEINADETRLYQVLSSLPLAARLLGDRILSIGDRGADVAQLQKMLELEADGDFGPATLEAVKTAQSELIGSADGIVGPVTLKALELWLQPQLPEQSKEVPMTDNQRLIHELLHTQVPREGSELGGHTTLHAVLANIDAAFESLRADVKRLQALVEDK